MGKLYGGHQATVISLAVGDSTAGTDCYAVTGSKDRCLKVIELFLLDIFFIWGICCDKKSF